VGIQQLRKGSLGKGKKRWHRMDGATGSQNLKNEVVKCEINLLLRKKGGKQLLTSLRKL
jgi:hypothetical protein